MASSVSSPSGGARHRAQRQGRQSRRGLSVTDKLVLILLVVAGFAVLLYPVAATYVRNTEQASVADAYRQSQTQISSEERERWIDEARAYNERTRGIPILDPWLARVSKDNAPYQDYLDQLNPSATENPVMAVLSIPAIDSKLPIYHGTEPDTLEAGIGHLYGSALPIGGEGNHSALTAHTGLTNATLFDRLNEVEMGDAFYLDVLGDTLKYEVHDIQVVLPDEVESLQPVAGEDIVTLITCTPYGINSHRLLVHGTRVAMDPAEAPDEAFDTGRVWQPWMIAVLAAAAVIAVIIAALIWRNRRRRTSDSATQSLTPEGSGDE